MMALGELGEQRMPRGVEVANMTSIEGIASLVVTSAALLLMVTLGARSLPEP